jgi:modification methylase
MHKEGGWVAKVASLAYSDDMPESEYQARQTALLRSWHDLLRNGGSVFYNHKNRYRDKAVISPLQWLPGPFSLRQEIIWRRPGSVTQNARMFLPSDERIYWLYKGTNFTFNDETEIKSWSTVWDIAPGGDKRHAVAFPVELPIRCIRASSHENDHVYDPFLGSGTTLIAAEMEGRVCHGLEIEPAFVDVAVKRYVNFVGGAGKVRLTTDGGRPVSYEKVFKMREGKAA